MSNKRYKFASFVVFALALALVAVPVVDAAKMKTHSNSVSQSTTSQTELSEYFTKAAKEFNVPDHLLLAIGYAESRWQDHDGKPSQLNGYGIMHLADNPQDDSLKRAAELLSLSEERLKNSVEDNIRGAAAVLAELAKEANGGNLPSNIQDWYIAVAAYSGLDSREMARWYADEVYAILNKGAERVIDGKALTLDSVAVKPNRGTYDLVERGPALSSAAEYPSARWVAAHSSNYTAANRSSFRYIIIHTTEGSYSGAISWFQNPISNVSAHYVIRSRDGEITQMVKHKDVAWHAGNWDYNQNSIGIEHEAYVNDPAWFTDTMYKSSAALTRWLADRYGIPKTRQNIIGHNQVPGATHSDPGKYWDWNYYMSLVTGNPAPGTEIIVDDSTPGRFVASENWGTSEWSAQKYGNTYRFATPEKISDSAWYKVNIPAQGQYDVYARWPANSGYNSKTPFVIVTTSGNQTVHVDQTKNGGQWVRLGTFSLAQGDRNIVAVSRWTNTPGYVIADAIKVVKR